MRKLIGLSLAAVMIASLTACGGGAKDTAPAEADSKEAAEANDDAKEETKAEAGEAVSGKEFVIGGLGPLTGESASYGLSVKQGAQLAVDEINEAGGVKVGEDTYILKLNFLDDVSDAETSVTAYNSLMDQGMGALLGCVTTGPCLAVVDLSAQDGILQVTPSASAIAVTDNDNVFRLCFTDPLQGEMMAQYVVDNGYKSAAVLYNNADEYSTGIYEAFKAKLDEIAAGTLVAEESFAIGDVEFGTQLTKIKNSGAEVIFVPAYYGDAAYITQQAKSAGIEADFIGSDGWDGVLAQVTDKSAVEGAVFLSPFLVTDPAVADFVKTYETLYKASPDQFAADGYDTVNVIKAAMEKAGSVESADLIAAMTEIEVKGLTGDVSFDASGEPKKGAKFIKIVNGEYTALE